MGTRRREQLPEESLNSLGSLLDAIRDAIAVDDEWTADASLHFLRNYTTESVDPYLQFHLIRDDIRPVVSHGGYDTMVQECWIQVPPCVATNPISLCCPC